MTINTGDVVKVTARMELFGSIAIQNTFFAQSLTTSPIPEADAKADLAAWLETIYTPLNPAILSSMAYVDIQYHKMNTNTPLGVGLWPTLTAGGNAADPLVTGAAMVMTAYTAINRVRGRKFIGALAEDSITSGLVDAGTLALGAAALAAWIGSFAGATSGENWIPGVWRRKSSTFTSFTEAVVRAVPGYQRRRKQDVGI